MKKSILLTMSIALIFTLLLSCKKIKSDPPPLNPTRAALLQAHSWRFNPDFYLVKNNMTTPYAIPSCFLDDTLDYRSNGMYIKDAGPTLCSNQAQQDTLSWELRDNDMNLRVNNKGIIIDKEILTLKDDSLITREINTNGDTNVFIYLKF